MTLWSDEYPWQVPAAPLVWALLEPEGGGFQMFRKPRTGVIEWLEPEQADDAERRGIEADKEAQAAVLATGAMRDGGPSPRPFLVQSERGMTTASYRPLRDQPGLFHRFADLEPTAAAILPFANRFGLLTGGEQAVRPPWDPQPVATEPSLDELTTWRGDDTAILIAAGKLLPAESLLLWTHQIMRMKAAVQLFDALRGTDPDETIIRLLNLKEWNPTEPTETSYLGFPIRIPKVSDRVPFATGLLESFIDDAFSKRVSHHWADRGLVPLRFMDGALKAEPPNLLGAMWLQLAVAVEEGKQFKRCPGRGCGLVWFEKSTATTGKREDAEFCSPSCRHTAYRDRKAKARELFKASDGSRAAIRRIAKTLNTDDDKVRGWVRGVTAHS